MKAKKIKLLHLTTDSQMGGTEKMILAFMKKSSQDFYNILVILKKNGPLSKLASNIGIKTYSLNINNLWDLPKLYQLLKILKKEQPDILHTYLFHANIAGRIIGKLYGIKHILCGQRNIDPWRKWYHSYMDKLTSSFVQAYISNTQAGKKRLIEIEKISEEKIFVIPNGIEKHIPTGSFSKKTLRSRFNLPENAIILLHMGSFTKKKGQSFLVEAFISAAKTKENIHLLLAGDGPLREKVSGLASLSPISERIHFPGTLDNIYDVLPFCDLFIMPSLWEGMPNALLEAMASGIPIIASDVGGIPELVTDGIESLLVPPQNSQALAEKITFAIKHPERMKSLAQKAKEKAISQFSLQKMIERLEDFYRKTVNT